MRVLFAIAAGIAVSACEFVQVQPVPTPVPIPLPATVRGGPPAAPALPPSPAQMQAAMGAMSNVEVCEFLYHPVYGSDAVSEITQRGDFSDYELARILRREIADGMSEESVRCAFGEPGRIRERSRDNYDLVYDYDNEELPMGGGWRGQMLVYFRDDIVVDFEQIPRSSPMTVRKGSPLGGFDNFGSFGGSSLTPSASQTISTPSGALPMQGSIHDRP